MPWITLEPVWVVEDDGKGTSRPAAGRGKGKPAAELDPAEQTYAFVNTDKIQIWQAAYGLRSGHVIKDGDRCYFLEGDQGAMAGMVSGWRAAP